MKKVLVCLLSVAAVVLSLCGCGKNESATAIRIGVSIPAADHGWSGGVVWNADELKKELEQKYPGTKIINVTAKDSADQVSGINNMLMQGVDALVVMSQDPVPLLKVCKDAKKSGVFLVVVSNPLAEPIYDVFVNGDNRSFGIEASRALGKAMDGKGDIVVLKGQPCPIDNDRVGGFCDTLKAEFPDIRILASGDAYWNAEKGQKVMEQFLMQYSKIDGVWAGDDDVLSGVLKAYAKSGRSDVKVFVGGGGAKSVVKMLMDKDPLVKATVTYSPAMIRTGVMAAFEALQKKGEPVKEKEIIIPSRIITGENAAEHYFPNSPY